MEAGDYRLSNSIAKLLTRPNNPKHGTPLGLMTLNLDFFSFFLLVIFLSPFLNSFHPSMRRVSLFYEFLSEPGKKKINK